jgi:hypothetical protein
MRKIWRGKAMKNGMRFGRMLKLLALGAVLVVGGFGGIATAGPHYSLNIIAVPENNRPPDSKDGAGHTIIGPLDTVRGNVDCRIFVTAGTTFDTVDRFCLDGDASFTLPDPDPDNYCATEYQVWIALAGKPNGGANLTTCKVVSGEEECSLENTFEVTGSRKSGTPQWTNVTRELLTLCYDTDDDGTCDTREYLFDDKSAQYLWAYDNFGNRIAKLRFYPISQAIACTP